MKRKIIGFITFAAVLGSVILSAQAQMSVNVGGGCSKT